MIVKGNGRETALYILQKIDKENAWADALLSKAIELYELDKRDAALCSRIVYGILQNKYLLDYYIDLFCSQGIHHLEGIVRNTLYIGAYQILFMDKVPVSAAVNESVEMMKRNHYARASGLVNAVLRKLVPFHEQLPELKIADELERIGVTYSIPMWLIRQLKEEGLSASEVEAYCKSCNEEVSTTIQVNTTKIDSQQLERRFLLDGVAYEKHLWMPNCYELKGIGNIETIPSYREGLFYVQDASSKLVALALPKIENKEILDVCAAPGGKSIAMAIAGNDHCKITSCDIYPNKLKQIEKQCQRLSLRSISTCVQNGKDFVSEWKETKDIVLVDAPCSGFGIIRKKPDIRYKDASSFWSLPKVQLAILENASKYVKKNGILVYSTCTIFKKENQDVVQEFLTKHPEFSFKKIELPNLIGTIDGYITIWPHIHHSDGFFIAVMRKNNDD